MGFKLQCLFIDSLDGTKCYKYKKAKDIRKKCSGIGRIVNRTRSKNLCAHRTKTAVRILVQILPICLENSPSGYKNSTPKRDGWQYTPHKFASESHCSA